MPNKKITAMPSLAGNQVPTDLVTAVDLSAAPVNQNVKSTLNDLFATITKNITDRAIRFQAPGSAPAVAAASQGALYHDGTAFLASSNGGAYEPLYTLSAQSAALVFAGPTSGPAATPTFRALALTDLPAGIGTVTSVGLSAPSFLNVANSPVTGSGTLDLSLATQSAALVFAGPTSGPAATPTFRALALTDLPSIATASLLGRSSAGTGTPEQISSTAALLTWLQNPISNNLSAAVTDSTGAGGALVFAFNPILTNPRFNSIAADPSGSGSNLLFTPSVGAVNHVEILNATAGNGPTIRPAGLSANQPLNLASRGTGIISCVANQLRVTGNTAAAAGILELRGGNASLSGGQIRLYEVTTNGTNYIGFQAPDNLASNLLFELPSTDGTAGQVLSTDGAGILSWATRGTGTVTSVGLSAPSIFTVTNSPVTGSGTLTLALASQGQAQVFASPVSVGGGTPSFRSLQVIDLPQIASNSLLGRTSAGVGPTQSIFTSAEMMNWIQTPTSANLAAAVTDETGTGALVFNNSPVLQVNCTVPTVIGGVAANSSLTLRSTSGTGTTGADIVFQSGNNGSVEIARMTNSGILQVGTSVGSTTPSKLTIYDPNKVLDSTGNLTLFSTNAQAADLGSTIGLGGRNGSGGAFDPWAFASIRGAKANGTSGDLSGYFLVGTSTAGGTITERFRVDSAGNFKLGGTADRSTTAGTNQVVIYNGTAPVGTLTNGCSFYATAGEMRVMDAAGNATLLSPHDGANYWVHDSEHTPTGRRLVIEVEKLLRFLNAHFELDFIHETTISIGEQS